MRPRSQGPSDGDGAQRERDAAWDEVLDPPPTRMRVGLPRASGDSSGEASGGPSGEARGVDGEPQIAESAPADMPTQTLELDSMEPDQRVEHETRDASDMDAMMSGSWAMATRDASGPLRPVLEAPSQRELRESDAEMAAIMGAQELAARTLRIAEANAASRTTATQAGITPRASAQSVAATPSAGPSAGRVSGTEAASPTAVATATEVAAPIPIASEVTRPIAIRPKTSPPIALRPGSAHVSRRMHTPEAPRLPPRNPPLDLDAKPKRLSLGWAVVAGVGIAGIAWVIGGPARDGGAPRAAGDAAGRVPEAAVPPTGAVADATPPVPQADPVALARTEADGPAAPAEETPPPAAKPVAKPPAAQDPKAVRTPPPGTPPEIATTFARLPVSAADLPPVGGVGEGGIHIDRVEMGGGYDNKTGCVDVAKNFSFGANEVINVCVRVVHPRQDEVMSIVWQKNDGSTARRGKIAVKPIHAYRTRAYLRLREEYIGDWTVRIQSADGVELASHAFTITR